LNLERKVISSPNAPKGRGPFPQAIQYNNQLFISGQGPLDPITSTPVTGTFESEVHLTIQNISKIVAGANLELKDALKLTIYLTDLTNIPKFNEIYTQYFSEPYPARTLVQAGLRGIQVEIDGIFACRGGDYA
jgi:2-iminobutanoate/2-iminopropanoate deaminase